MNGGHIRFSLRQLFIAVAVVAALLGIWLGWIRQTVSLRAANPGDEVFEEYFGFVSQTGNSRSVSPRNVAVAEGTFSKGTRLSIWLHHVRSGRVQCINSLSVGRSPQEIGGPIWRHMKLTIALGDETVGKRRFTMVGCAGHSNGGGSSGLFKIGFDVKDKKTLPGRLTAGMVPSNPCILYVEGDRTVNVSREMTVDEFALNNAGEYLVVSAQLR